MKFKVAIPTTDYTVSITSSGGLAITFKNVVHYNNFKSYIECGKYPLLCFSNDTYMVIVGNYVLCDSKSNIRAVFYLNSDEWGNAIQNNTMPLYFIVG